ncbi:MAG: uncharacterized protein PWQ96_1367 [Clostridia bacterium]|jgi:hypothetical protein|nr:putative nucleic acid-binding protein [Clostridiales bacterium]MDK2985725.1 uncharacterized protein [Clostridia bacterium]
MRVVIDTNVLISGMLSKKSYPAAILDGWIMNRFQPVVSPELVEEYSKVLIRKKFERLGSVRKRLALLEKLLNFPWITLVYPEEKLKIIAEDPKDDMVLECAVAGKAKRIVTGDEHLLKLRFFRKIEIVTSRHFIEDI